MDRPNINNVKFSNVASGLHAKTEDHILVTAHDVFDFTYTYTDSSGNFIVGEYQDVINQLNKGGGGTSWTPTAGFAISITPGTGSYQFSVDESQLSFSLAKLREYMLKGYPSSTNPIQVSEIMDGTTFKGWLFTFDKSKTDLVDAATLTAALANYQKILTAPLGSGISIDTDNKISVLVDDSTIKIDPTTGKLYAASTGETYQGGEGITIDTTTVPKSIKVDSSVYQVKSLDSTKGLDNTSGVASIKIDESSMEFTAEGKLKAKAGAAYEAGTGIKFTPSADKTSISVDDTVYKVKDASGGLKITSDAKVVVDEDVYKIKDIATQDIAGTQVPVGLALDGDGKIGVLTESTSITFNPAGRLMVSLESNGGITATSGLKVDDSIYTIKKIADTNSGLTSVSGVIAVNTGNGIDVDSNGIKVKVDSTSPISVSTSGVGLKVNTDDFIIDTNTLRGRKLVKQISASASTETGSGKPYALDIALASPQASDTHPSIVIPASQIAYTPYLSTTTFKDTQSAIGFILLKTCEPQVTEFTVSGQPAPGSTTMFVTFKSAATTRYGISPEFVKYEVFAPGATAWAEASTIEGGTYSPGGTEGWLVGDYYFRAKYQAYISSAGEHVSSYSEIVEKTIVGSMYVDYTDKADYPEGYTEYIIPTQYATTTITQHVDEGVVLRTPTARESTSHINLWVFTPKECGKALHFYRSDGSEISWVASGIATVRLGGHDYYAQKLSDIGLNEPFSTAIVMLRDVQVNDTSIVNAGVAKIVANTSKGLDFKNTSAAEGLEVKVDESTVKFDTGGKVSSAIWTVPTAAPTEFKTDKETGYINDEEIMVYDKAALSIPYTVEWKGVPDPLPSPAVECKLTVEPTTGTTFTCVYPSNTFTATQYCHLLDATSSELSGYDCAIDYVTRKFTVTYSPNFNYFELYGDYKGKPMFIYTGNYVAGSSSKSLSWYSDRKSDVITMTLDEIKAASSNDLFNFTDDYATNGTIYIASADSQPFYATTTNGASYISFVNCSKIAGDLSDLMGGTTAFPARAFSYTFSEAAFGTCYLSDCAGMYLAKDFATMGAHCFDHMFYGCTQLVSPVEQFYVTSLVEGCYESMFEDCHNLRQTPYLYAESLVTDCYKNMFKNCYCLELSICAAKTEEDATCRYDMFLDAGSKLDYFWLTIDKSLSWETDSKSATWHEHGACGEKTQFKYLG